MTRYEWDENKNQANLAKHGISFETAILIFEDPHIVSEIERIIDGEERWQSVGRIGSVLIVLVAHTWRSENESDESFVSFRLEKQHPANARSMRSRNEEIDCQAEVRNRNSNETPGQPH